MKTPIAPGLVREPSILGLPPNVFILAVVGGGFLALMYGYLLPYGAALLVISVPLSIAIQREPKFVAVVRSGWQYRGSEDA